MYGTDQTVIDFDATVHFYMKHANMTPKKYVDELVDKLWK